MICTISLNGLVRQMISKYGDNAEHKLWHDYKISFNQVTGKFKCEDKRSPFHKATTVATYKRRIT